MPAVDDTTASATSTWSSQQIASALATAGTKVINDASVAPTTTWSSAKLDAAIKAVPAVDDTTASATSTWSSQKVNSMLSSTMPIVSPATAGDLASLTASGTVTDSGFRVDDAADAAAKILWSSNAIKSALATKMSSVSGTTANQIAFFDGAGGLAPSSSGVVLSDTAPAGPGVIWSSEKTMASLDGKQNLVASAKANDIAFFDSKGQVVDKGVIFDDAAPASASVVWSSQMTSGALAKNQKLVPTATANRLAAFDSTGQTQDSGVRVDDAAAASQSVLWSSAKILAATGSQQLVPTATAGNFATFDAAGSIVDAGVAVSDTAAASPSVLWSSSAIDAKMMKKQNLVPSALKGNLAAFDAAGQVVDGGVALNDAAAAGSNVVWSSQKLMASQQPLVVPAAAGNLASLNASGQVTDSTFAVSDASPAGPNVLWSSQKMASSLPYQKMGATPSAGSFLVFDSAGQSIESGAKIDDTAAPSAKTLWSSQKASAVFQTKVSPSVTGNIAALDATGQVVNAGYALNDAAGPSTTVLWSSAKMATSKQNFIANPAAGGLVSTDAAGQTIMSPYTVDDAAAAGSAVLWTSAKLASAIPSGTAKNVTVIGATGSGVADSGMKIDDSAPAGPNVLWSSQKMSSIAGGLSDSTTSNTSTWSSAQTSLAINDAAAKKMDLVPTASLKSLARFGANGQVESSGFVIDDTALSASALWSSLKNDTTYQKLVKEAIAGDIATFNSTGQVSDSGFKFDNTAISNTTIPSSKHIYDNYSARKAGRINAGQFIVFEGIRFGIANPSGLTLQCEPTTQSVGSWNFSSTISLNTSNFNSFGSQFMIPLSTQAPASVAPVWTLITSQCTESIVRLDTGPMYRVVVVINPGFVSNNIAVQKLA